MSDNNIKVRRRAGSREIDDVPVPEPPRSTQRKKARRPAPVKKHVKVIWIIAAVLVVLCCYTFYMLSVLGVGEQHFYKGIYICGVDMSGYTYEAGAELVNSMVDEWENRSFTLTYQEQSWTINCTDFDVKLDLSTMLQQAWNLGHTGNIFQRKSQILSLRENPVYMTSGVTYDESKVDELVSTLQSAIDVDPVDAVIAVGKTEPEIVQRSSVGYSLEAENVKADIISLIENGSDNDTLALKVDTVEPAVSSGSAEDGIQLIVEWTTDTSKSSSKRTKNVKLALSKFNGMVLTPGMQVSFNAVVGKRTVENGFTEAPEYNGTTVQTGIGGGTCQASSTIYGAILKLGLQIDERTNHNMTVSYTKASWDAAVSDKGQDLKFTNDTENTYYIFTYCDRSVAAVRIYGVRQDYRVELESTITQDNITTNKINYVEDTEGTYCWYTDETKLKSEGHKGRRSYCTRIFYDWDTGEEVKREIVSKDVYYPGPDTYYIGIHERE